MNPRLRARDLARIERCRRGVHTITSTVRINGGEPVTVCSWCSHGWPALTTPLAKRIEQFGREARRRRT